MRGFSVPSVLVLLALLVVLASLCASGEGLLVTHADASEACCGVADCSALAMGIASLALWAVAAPFRLGATPANRLVSRPPLSPPPELTAFTA